MAKRTIEPYRDETLPERFLRWIETIRARFKAIPAYTESNGSPEGVIFGVKADRYFDLTGNQIYVKTTQTGNTGWVVVDTGGALPEDLQTTYGASASGLITLDDIIRGIIIQDNAVPLTTPAVLFGVNDDLGVSLFDVSTASSHVNLGRQSNRPGNVSSVHAWHDGTNVFNTILASAGGLEVNNLLTGLGLERVLTTSDIQAGFQGLGQWRYRTATASTPAAGRMQFDNVLINSATEMYVNVTNDNGVDMTAFLGLIQTDDLIYVQISGDASQYVVIQTGLPVLAAGVYTFPIQLAEGVGSTPSNNTAVTLVTASAGGSAGGIANGTVEGSMLAWDVGNVAWEERTNVTYEEQVDYGQGLGNWLTIDNQVGNNTGIRMLVPGIEDLVIYADDADFITKVETQALQFSAPSGSNFLHTLRAGYVNNNNNIEFSNVAGPGKAIRTHTLGGFLELTAGNGASDVRIINGSTLKLQERTGALADTALMGQLYVDDSDQGLYYKFNATAAIRLDVAATPAPVDSVFTRTGAVVALVGDYSAHYLVKTGGAQTCVSDVTINGGGSLTIDDPTLNLRLRNSTDLLMYSAGNTENFRISQSASLVQFTGSGFAPPDHTLQIQNFVGLDINVQTYFQPPLATGGNSNPGTGASWNAPHGTAPSSPADGDYWTTTAGAFVRVNGVTHDLTAAAGGIVATPTPAIGQLAVWDSTGATLAGEPDLTYASNTLSMANTTGLLIRDGAYIRQASPTDTEFCTHLMDTLGIYRTLGTGVNEWHIQDGIELRVFDSGDTDYIGFLHNDVEGIISTNAGNLHLVPAGSAVNVIGNLIDLDNSANATASTIINRNSGGGITLNVNTTTGNCQLGQTSSAGAAEDVWIHMTRNGQVELRHNNTAMARTALIGSGGFEVNNTVTGGGFERVLTTSDIGGGGTIGGSITDNQVAVGATTANDIEGQAQLTFDVTADTLHVGDVSNRGTLELHDEGRIFLRNNADGDTATLSHAGSVCRLDADVSSLHLWSTSDIELRVDDGQEIEFTDGTGSGFWQWDSAVRIRFNQSIRVPDNKGFFCGDGADFNMNFDSTDMQMTVTGASAELQLRVNGGESAIVCTPNGAVELFFDNATSLQTQNRATTGVTSSGVVYDHVSGTHDIGFNDQTPFVLSADTTLNDQHAGVTLVKTVATAGIDITCPTGAQFPTGSIVNLMNLGNSTVGVLTTGITLQWPDGSTVNTGARTLAFGAVVTIYRRSATIYVITGSGIS